MAEVSARSGGPAGRDDVQPGAAQAHQVGDRAVLTVPVGVVDQDEHRFVVLASAWTSPDRPREPRAGGGARVGLEQRRPWAGHGDHVHRCAGARGSRHDRAQRALSDPSAPARRPAHGRRRGARGGGGQVVLGDGQRQATGGGEPGWVGAPQRVRSTTSGRTATGAGRSTPVASGPFVLAIASTAPDEVRRAGDLDERRPVGGGPGPAGRSGTALGHAARAVVRDRRGAARAAGSAAHRSRAVRRRTDRRSRSSRSRPPGRPRPVGRARRASHRGRHRNLRRGSR